MPINHTGAGKYFGASFEKTKNVNWYNNHYNRVSSEVASPRQKNIKCASSLIELWEQIVTSAYINQTTQIGGNHVMPHSNLKKKKRFGVILPVPFEIPKLCRNCNVLFINGGFWKGITKCETKKLLEVHLLFSTSLNFRKLSIHTLYPLVNFGRKKD